MEHIASIGMAAALAWASGIRLYAVLFILGLVGHFHLFGWSLPKYLEVLGHPMVMGATGLLLFLEFFADKIPGLDSVWDAVHTFIRIPAGALLAAGVIGADDGNAWALVAALLGGTVTAGTHFLKSGSRVAINTSPEPVSNVVASVAEDAAVMGGLWLAFTHPLVFLGFFILFVLIAIWLIPKIWRFIKFVVQRIVNFVSGEMPPARPA